MDQTTQFIDVVLPLSVPNLFTYRIPKTWEGEVKVGQRAIVPFGRGGKLYTALIRNIHYTPPKHYEAKYIDTILDELPIVNEQQLKHWEWMSNYYLAHPGDILNAALPGALKLASETKVMLNHAFEENPIEVLTDNEYQVYEALEVRNVLNLQEIATILSIKNVQRIVKALIEKNAVVVLEEIKNKYKPKLVSFVRLNPNASEEEQLQKIFEELGRAPKQLQTLMSYISLSNHFSDNQVAVQKTDLQKSTNVSAAIINTLVNKGIFETYDVQVDRIAAYDDELAPEKTLNEYQQKALQEIQTNLKEKDVTLLHGVTGSGKTEIYIRLIEEAIEQGRQVLYLLPEIALTTQLIMRLQKVFGDVVGVYHSKFNENERVEVWNEVLNFNNPFKVAAGKRNPGKFQIIMGARSSLFLPFSNLGLIIIDEEHENSFKQQDPAPRYHARDAAVVLANIHQAKVVMGSATPAVETYWNAQQGKYGYVELTKRHGAIQLPEIVCADVKEATRKRKMKGHFSPFLIELMQEALEQKEQIILFQNRRGYAPFLLCEECGTVPECNNCDVSLTYHKYPNLLKCHYCGTHKKMPSSCPACGSTRLTLKGFGTEQIEEELSILFPEIKVARMDADTTRNKNAYHQLITEFENQAIDILVGTQMVTKGLDFDNVSLVGILNADSMLHFPDFRSFERSYQLMSQVSGRAGRKKKRGKVVIQTYDPYHTIIRQVMEHDYKGMYKDEIIQRKNFHYPPFDRLIHFTLKHKDKDMLNAGAKAFTDNLKKNFGDRVLGPEFPLVARVKNTYRKHIMLKTERNLSVGKTRELILETKNKFESSSAYKSVSITIDVDPL